MTDMTAEQMMRSAIQKVATGPEYSKDLSFEEARGAMQYVLEKDSDPVRAAVYFIALRMKRETDDENKGVLQAIKDNAVITNVAVDELVDIADPYDGHARGLPMSAFIAPVLAANGVPAVCHGLESVGPKYGVTQHQVLKNLGIDVMMSPADAAKRLENPACGWAYLDQSVFARPLYDLIPLRTRIIKRQVLTTVEVLVGPLRARKQTHLLTGYVHKAYPPIYSSLARFSGFDNALIVRGVEGGVIPSLQQPGKVWVYHDKGEESVIELDPTSIGIQQASRAVPLPKDLPQIEAADDIANPFDAAAAAEKAAEAGIAALKGEKGPAYDSLVYAGAITLHNLKKYDSLAAAADAIRQSLDSGKALAHFKGEA